MNKFLVVHGAPNYDIDSAELIHDKLESWNQPSELLSDKDLSVRSISDAIIISVGGPAVNQASAHIQEIYGDALDVDIEANLKNFCFFFGSRGRYKHSNKFNLKACLAMWGNAEVHTIEAVSFFGKNGSLLQDIVENPMEWHLNNTDKSGTQRYCKSCGKIVECRMTYKEEPLGHTFNETLRVDPLYYCNQCNTLVAGQI